jgi:hypothetical protein
MPLQKRCSFYLINTEGTLHVPVGYILSGVKNLIVEVQNMIGRIILFIIVIGLVGLVVGYFIFGRVGGEYIKVKQVFQPSKNLIEDIAESITGLKKARRNIWISGAVGAALGLIVGAMKRRRT